MGVEGLDRWGGSSEFPIMHDLYREHYTTTLSRIKVDNADGIKCTHYIMKSLIHKCITPRPPPYRVDTPKVMPSGGLKVLSARVGGFLGRTRMSCVAL